MILRAYMEICDPYVQVFRHSVQDASGNEIAVGKNNSDKELFLAIEYQGKEYKFPRKIVKQEKVQYAFPYPLSSKHQKTLGYEVYMDGSMVMETYPEAATDKKVFFFKRNFLFNVYKYKGRAYHCFKVGFADELSHYHFIKTVDGETVAAIERVYYSEDDRRATIYLKDPELLEMILLICGYEIMFVFHRATDYTDVVDASAGNYISITDGEKAMFDKDFILAVKAMHGIYD